MKKVLSVFAAVLFTVAVSNAVFAEGDKKEETVPATADAAAAPAAEAKDGEKAAEAEAKGDEKPAEAEAKGDEKPAEEAPAAK